MVELATLQAVSYIMGSLGVFVGTVYYIMNMRATEQELERIGKLRGFSSDTVRRFRQWRPEETKDAG